MAVRRGWPGSRRPRRSGWPEPRRQRWRRRHKTSRHGIGSAADVLLRPLSHAAVVFLGRNVLDAGPHRPALAEWIEDRGEPVAGDEGLGGFANRCAGLLCLCDDRVDVLAVEADGVGGRCRRIGCGDLIGLTGIAELQATIVEVQFGVRDRAVGAVHPVDEFGAEYRNVELDCGRGAVDAQERGQAGVALRNCFNLTWLTIHGSEWL